MTRKTLKKAALIAVPLVLIAFMVVGSQLSSVAASAILHPFRREFFGEKPATCEDRQFTGHGIVLRGWFAPAMGKRRGTIIYLHGVADNRGSGAGLADRFTRQGFDFVAYDSRAQGNSGGELCTYGYLEKEDLRRVVDSLAPGPVILIGSSLGAAVALQEAATDDRITAIVAAEVFSDFRSIATERAPSLLPDFELLRVFRSVEEIGGFHIDDVSPVESARKIRIPVLVIHGANDKDTSPEHSRRVFNALSGSKRLILVPNAGHNSSLSGPEIWNYIDQWLAEILAASGSVNSTQR